MAGGAIGRMLRPRYLAWRARMGSTRLRTLSGGWLSGCCKAMAESRPQWFCSADSDGTMKAMSLRAAGALLVVLAAQGFAAIWPDQIGTFERKPASSLTLPDRPLYEEFGFEATEQADYAGPSGKFTATAWRMKDSTGALALFESRRPAGAKPAKLTKLSVTTDDGVILAYGNYVLQFTGRAPAVAELSQTLDALPRLEQGPLPTLMTYLPAEGLIPNSERFILGPVSLERFEPRIAPSLAAFHMGAEGQFAKYKSPAGVETSLMVFSYPTPSMARERTEAFHEAAGRDREANGIHGSDCAAADGSRYGGAAARPSQTARSK